MCTVVDCVTSLLLNQRNKPYNIPLWGTSWAFGAQAHQICLNFCMA